MALGAECGRSTDWDSIRNLSNTLSRVWYAPSTTNLCWANILLGIYWYWCWQMCKCEQAASTSWIVSNKQMSIWFVYRWMSTCLHNWGFQYNSRLFTPLSVNIPLHETSTSRRTAPSLQLEPMVLLLLFQVVDLTCSIFHKVNTQIAFIVPLSFLLIPRLGVMYRSICTHKRTLYL